MLAVESRSQNWYNELIYRLRLIRCAWNKLMTSASNLFKNAVYLGDLEKVAKIALGGRGRWRSLPSSPPWRSLCFDPDKNL